MAKHTTYITSEEFPNPFDASRKRSQQVVSAQNQGIPFEIKAVPDAEIIRNLVSYGQPLHAAQDVTKDPTGQARLLGMRFLFDCEDAARGDKEARQRVDALRYMWAQLRKEELIADDPTRQHNEIIDPRILL